MMGTLASPTDCTPERFRREWRLSRDLSDDAGPTDAEIEEWINLARIGVPVCLPHCESIDLIETDEEADARFSRDE